jgi:hypothetical protein
MTQQQEEHNGTAGDQGPKQKLWHFFPSWEFKCRAGRGTRVLGVALSGNENATTKAKAQLAVFGPAFPLFGLLWGAAGCHCPLFMWFEGVDGVTRHVAATRPLTW